MEGGRDGAIYETDYLRLETYLRLDLGISKAPMVAASLCGRLTWSRAPEDETLRIIDAVDHRRVRELFIALRPHELPIMAAQDIEEPESFPSGLFRQGSLVSKLALHTRIFNTYRVIFCRDTISPSHFSFDSTGDEESSQSS